MELVILCLKRDSNCSFKLLSRWSRKRNKGVNGVTMSEETLLLALAFTSSIV